MANYRQVHVKMWKDNWFLELAPEEKLLYVYLFSNDLTSLSGIYQISQRVIAFETGLAQQCVVDTMKNFQSQGKIEYEDGYIWIKKLRKYHETSSPKVQTHIRNDLDSIPDIPLKTRYIAYYQPNIPYPYPMDTQSQEEEEEEEELKEKKEENININGKNDKSNTPKVNIWKLLLSYGVDRNPRVEQIVKQPFMTPEYLRSHVKALDRKGHEMPKCAGMLVLQLETGVDPGHEPGCQCEKCLEAYTSGEFSKYIETNGRCDYG